MTTEAHYKALNDKYIDFLKEIANRLDHALDLPDLHNSARDITIEIQKVVRAAENNTLEARISRLESKVNLCLDFIEGYKRAEEETEELRGWK